MSLQDAIAAELPFLRAQAEGRMVSRVTIRRKTERFEQNEWTGVEEPVWDEVYVDHPFRLGGTDRGGSGTRTLTLGGVELQVAIRTGHLPATTSDLADDDFIEVTVGENAGDVFRIVEADWQDQSTARRVPLISEDRPTEWGPT